MPDRACTSVRQSLSYFATALQRQARSLLHLVTLAWCRLRKGPAVARHFLLQLASIPTRMKRSAISFIHRTADYLVVRVAVPIGRHRTRVRLAQGVPASIWGVTPILTLPLKARADQMLGFESRSLVFVTYYITQNFDYNLQRVMAWLRNHAGGLVYPFEQLLLAWAIWRFDVFHYFYDQGLTSRATRFGVNPRELDLLKASGKRVYLYAYGADVRRRDETLVLGEWNFCKECPEPTRFCACTSDNALVMAEMARKATCAIALGDMLTYVPFARNMHYWPIDLERVKPALSTQNSGPFRIAHAPNHAHFKGSHYLEAAIEKLQTEGHQIVYTKVHGISNEEVIRVFGEADLIADQFVGGAYGYTALEAMARGKPVITYVRSSDLVEAFEECPLINATPDTLIETLRWCISHREKLQLIGTQGRAYVERWHCIEAVAERFGRMYEETANFPAQTMAAICEQRAREVSRRALIRPIENWQHPYQVKFGDISKGRI
jgi:hypothetical protein